MSRGPNAVAIALDKMPYDCRDERPIMQPCSIRADQMYSTAIMEIAKEIFLVHEGARVVIMRELQGLNNNLWQQIYSMPWFQPRS